MVCGGARYFSRIVLASTRRRVSIARAGRLDAGRVGALVRLEQPLVVLARELAVDRQPDRLAVAAPAGQLDRVVDALRSLARHRLDVARVLLRREHLLEQGAELHLAEDAARLDVAQHAAERADVAGQLLHLADAAMHLLEPLGDLAEALAEALLERRVQLLVDGGADLLELLLVVCLDRAEPRSRPSACTSAMRWSLARTSASQLVARASSRELLQRRRLARPCALERRVERFARQPRLLDLRRGRLAERIGELLLHRRELAAEAVDLLVLRARRVALLRQQRLLEERRAWRRAPGAFPGRCASTSSRSSRGLALERPDVDRRPAQRDPQGDGDEEREQRRRPASRKASAIVAARARRPGCAQRRLSARPAAAAPSARRDRSRPGRAAPAPRPAARRRA